jgi:hypothetical protein
VWYGPDTYMGQNLAQLFTMLAELSDEEVREQVMVGGFISLRILAVDASRCSGC